MPRYFAYTSQVTGRSGLQARLVSPVGSLLGVLAILVYLLSPPSVFATTINFEGFADGTPITTQYPGLVFSDATIATAGISLNEFEFPPQSGVNVVFDDGGPITITFSTPVSSFDAFFTYSVPLTLDAFNAGRILVGSASSLFSNNEALSGDLGSSPNEVLQALFPGGISSVEILGDPSGSSFTMDDVTYTPVGTPTPEPSSLVLFLTGGAIFAGFRKRFSRGRNG